MSDPLAAKYPSATDGRPSDSNGGTGQVVTQTPTGMTLSGQPMPQATAEAWAKYGNETYPDLSHRVLPVTTPKPF